MITPTVVVCILVSLMSRFAPGINLLQSSADVLNIFFLLISCPLWKKNGINHESTF
jgi:hypothetical protein